MLYIPLVGRNIVGEKSDKGVKSKDDDDMQRVMLWKGWPKHLKYCKTNDIK